MPSAHSILHYHIIFSTKPRRPFTTTDLALRLYDYIGGIILRENGFLTRHVAASPPPVESQLKDLSYFHIYEDDQFDEEFVASWIRPVSELPRLGTAKACTFRQQLDRHHFVNKICETVDQFL